MTFRRIGDFLDRRRESVAQARRPVPGVRDVVRNFLKEVYGATAARGCMIEYANDTMTIRSRSRAVADSIVLKAGELSAVVRAARFPLKRIVVS